MKLQFIFTSLFALLWAPLVFAKNIQEVCQLTKERSLVMSLHHNSTSNILNDSIFHVRNISTQEDYPINLRNTSYDDFRVSCSEDKLFFFGIGPTGTKFSVYDISELKTKPFENFSDYYSSPMKPGPPNRGKWEINVDGRAIGLLDSSLFQNGSKLTVFEESKHPTTGFYIWNIVQIDWLTGQKTLLSDTFHWRRPLTDGVRYGEGQLLVLDLFEEDNGKYPQIVKVKIFKNGKSIAEVILNSYSDLEGFSSSVIFSPIESKFAIYGENVIKFWDYHDLKAKLIKSLPIGLKGKNRNGRIYGDLLVLASEMEIKFLSVDTGQIIRQEVPCNTTSDYNRPPVIIPSAGNRIFQVQYGLCTNLIRL